MTSRMTWLVVGAVLGLASSAAVAFQETKGGQATKSDELNLDTSGTGTSIDTSRTAAGFEVRIPGLGKLGVLPKFDFGLELLYGVNDAKQDTSDKLRAPQGDEGTQIRGSLKHRF